MPSEEEQAAVFAVIRVRLQGCLALKKGGRKSKGTQQSGEAVIVDRLGRQHAVGDLWRAQREAARLAREAAAAATPDRQLQLMQHG